MEEVRETEEPISFHSHIKDAILKGVLLGYKKLREETLLQTEY